MDGWIDGVLCIHDKRYIQSTQEFRERAVLYTEVHGKELRNFGSTEEIAVSSSSGRAIANSHELNKGLRELKDKSLQ